MNRDDVEFNFNQFRSKRFGRRINVISNIITVLFVAMLVWLSYGVWRTS